MRSAHSGSFQGMGLRDSKLPFLYFDVFLEKKNVFIKGISHFYKINMSFLDLNKLSFCISVPAETVNMY